ncbi:MAG: hypothetical protein IJS42_02775 [Synergistaceae bacterium]|nr:hypothetical protein [Synergistaceae bacterium]
MSLDKLLRWVLFSAGIITVIFSGYMFHVNRLPEASACLSLSVGFLCFATRINPGNTEPELSSSSSQDANKDLHDMAALIADIAVSSLQNIGRTVPPTTKEITELEEKLNVFLDSMPLNSEEREDIAERIDSVKNRTRRNEGGRAILRSARL